MQFDNFKAIVCFTLELGVGGRNMLPSAFRRPHSGKGEQHGCQFDDIVSIPPVSGNVCITCIYCIMYV